GLVKMSGGEKQHLWGFQNDHLSISSDPFQGLRIGTSWSVLHPPEAALVGKVPAAKVFRIVEDGKLEILGKEAEAIQFIHWLEGQPGIDLALCIAVPGVAMGVKHGGGG